MQITLKEIETEYRTRIQSVIDSGTTLSPAIMITHSAKLYQEIKVRDISDDDFPENDMLLYQYGINDFGNDADAHFCFDITRQFIGKEDEPYQLSVALIYDSGLFEGIGSYDCWSDEFPDIESFCRHIQDTEGFRKAENLKPSDYRIQFEQC